jgi:hypothetical protein
MKRPDCAVDHSFPFTAEVKVTVELYLLYAFMS